MQRVRKKVVADAGTHGKMKETNEEKGIEVHTVGKIDKKIYKCITDDIVTDEVIITDERIAHIMERHPNDYEAVVGYMAEAVQKPDYILKDERINTGLIIKSMQQDNIQIVLRVHTSKDESGYKNSIISCWKISERRLQNYLRNKEILYKKE